MGLAAAVAIQAMALSGPASRGFIVAAFFAGLAVGIRSQIMWLTVPLLTFLLFHHGGRGHLRARPGWPESVSAPPSASPAVNSLQIIAAYTCGVLVWAVPLIALSGGPAAYVRALSRQGTEDLTGVRMLATSPTVSTLINALYYTSVAPWATWPIATAVLLLAAVGADNADKQELEPQLLASSKVVADILEQCAEIGDLHHALEAGLMKQSEVHAELGEIVVGRKEGRSSEQEVTIFDSTGTALQDVAAAAIVYERATERECGRWFRF